MICCNSMYLLFIILSDTQRCRLLHPFLPEDTVQIPLKYGEFFTDSNGNEEQIAYAM